MLAETTGGFPRIGLVGCGMVGDLHRERLLAEGAEIRAICDPDAEALARMARRLPRRPRLFRSELDLLAANLVDAVVLCTPHGRHAAQIQSALDAGVHVLCEKPFVTRAADAVALVRAAREKNLALFVSFTRRSRGHARFLEDAVTRIGPLRQVVILRSQPWLQRHERTWRLRESEGGGFLLDAGASMLDMALRMVPDPTISESHTVLRRRSNADVDVEASVRITFGQDVQLEMTLIGDATEDIESIYLFGERGTASWEKREETPHTLYCRVAGGPTTRGVAADFRVPLPDAQFVAALRSGRRFDDDGCDDDLHGASSALPLVSLVESLYRDAEWK